MVATYKRFKEEIKEFEKARENKVKNKSLLEIFFTLLAEKASIDFLEKELRKECLSVEEKNAVKKCCIEAKKSYTYHYKLLEDIRESLKDTKESK